MLATVCMPQHVGVNNVRVQYSIISRKKCVCTGKRRIIIVGHQPFATQVVKLAAHLELWSDNAAVQQTMCFTCALLHHKVGKMSSLTRLASGTSVSGSTSCKKTKRQVTAATFKKWQVEQLWLWCDADKDN